jgi:catechol 2,3-dioxygenase-like lactoylglutathione lyase family enzyme
MTDPADWDWSRAIFDHVHLRVADLERSKNFYVALLEPLGIPLMLDAPHLVGLANLAISADGPPSQNVHLAFVAESDAAVQAFHAAGLAAGGTDNGAPGEREYGPPDLRWYAAYVLDPDGNNIEAVSHAPA